MPLRLFSRLLLVATLALFGLTLGPISQAYAQRQDIQRPTAVLNVEGHGIDQDVTVTLTDILRREVQQAMYQVVDAKPVSLSDIVLLLGCDASTSSCLSDAAGRLEVELLVYGVVTREQGLYRVRMEIFDASTQEVSQRFQETIPLDEDLVVAFRRGAQAFFEQVRQERMAANLSITSNVRGARVVLNGEAVGVTPFERTGLTPGIYAVKVDKEGFTSWEAELELGPRARMRMRAPLQKLGAQPPSPVVVNAPEPASQGVRLDDEVELPKQRARPNWGAWSLVTIGGLSLAGSGVMALLFRGIERDIDALGDEESPSREEYSALMDRGESYELSHRVLLGAGIVGVVGGAAWLMIGRTRDPEAAALDPEAGSGLRLHASPAGIRLSF